MPAGSGTIPIEILGTVASVKPVGIPATLFAPVRLAAGVKELGQAFAVPAVQAAAFVPPFPVDVQRVLMLTG
jgi:hypothetical protein